MAVIEVGKLYHPSRKSWPECSQYNYGADGHVLELFYGSPTEIELAAIKAPGKQFALAIYESIIFLLYKLPGNDHWSDCPYSWWRVPIDNRAKPSDRGHAELLSWCMVDANTGIVKALGACNWSRDFTRTINEAIVKQTRRGYDAATYEKHIAAAYRRWPTADEMAADAVARCVGGQEIDRDEPLSPPSEGRPTEVAAWAGVSLVEVEAVSLADALVIVGMHPNPSVAEVLTENPALYWRANGRLFVDDPLFGPVVPVDELVYDSDLGLRHKDW